MATLQPVEALSGSGEASSEAARVDGPLVAALRLVLHEHFESPPGHQLPETAEAILSDYSSRIYGPVYIGAAEPDEVLRRLRRSSRNRLSLVQPDGHSETEANGGLSPHQHEVLRLIADGLDDPEIAERLVYGRRSIKYATSVIFTALDVNTRTREQAVRKGYEKGLLSPSKTSLEAFASPPDFSEEELDYLTMMSKGMKRPAIALEKGVSRDVVKHINLQIVKKLRARNRNHAVSIAISIGLIDVGPPGEQLTLSF